MVVGAPRPVNGKYVMPPEEASLAEDAKWTRAAFRAWSAEMPAELIADALGLQPTKLFRVGDPYSKRSTSIRREHLIIVESALPASDPLELHLTALCNLLDPVAPRLPGIA